MDISGIICDSYRAALKAFVLGTSATALARARERAFIKLLAARLQRAYSGEETRVFSGYGRGNAADFGAEKLLHEICLCRVAAGASGGRRAEEFVYIAATLWQIEVDFSQDWRPALYAINRLNAGAAASKALIAAAPKSGRTAFLDTLKTPFAAGGGTCYLALLPHPTEWEETDAEPQVWRLVDGEWEEVP